MSTLRTKLLLPLPLALTLLLAFGSSNVLANTYQFKVFAKGVVSPQTTPVFGSFTVPAKFMGSAPFTLTPPSSNSSGAFTFSSSNPGVATVSGNAVTIVGQGQTTITAKQAATAQALEGQITAVLTVSAPLPSGYTAQGGLIWTPHSYYDASPYPNGQVVGYAALVSSCAGTFNGTSGWRVPTRAELLAMFSSDALGGSSRYLGWLRASDSTSPGTHVMIQLSTGQVGDVADTTTSWQICVKPG